MKRIAQIIIILYTTLCGCTQHDGYIGHLFGMWTMDSITCNGEPFIIEGRGVVFKFQNKILQIDRLYTDPYISSSCYGNFRHEGDDLILTYLTGDDAINGGYDHRPPTWLGFPNTNQPFTLHFSSLTHSKMILRYTSADGDVYIYSLSKLN